MNDPQGFTPAEGHREDLRCHIHHPLDAAQARRSRRDRTQSTVSRWRTAGRRLRSRRVTQRSPARMIDWLVIGSTGTRTTGRSQGFGPLRVTCISRRLTAPDCRCRDNLQSKWTIHESVNPQAGVNDDCMETVQWGFLNRRPRLLSRDVLHFELQNISVRAVPSHPPAPADLVFVTTEHNPSAP